MQIRENLIMDSGTTFTNRRGYTISITTLIILVAFFICSVIAASFLVYNFAVCPNTINSKTTLTSPSSASSSSSSSETSQTFFDLHHGSPIDPAPSYDDSLDTKIFDVNPPNLINATLSRMDNNVRLPRSVVPIEYNISLIPFLIENNFTFHGEITIKVKIIENCDNITLHAADLLISRNNVIVHELKDDKNDSIEIFIKSQYFIETKQFFILKFYRPLIAGTEYKIYIKYVGHLRDYLQGFYRSSYKIGNEKRWLAATQFQPTDARRAFPCFDEPALKANFILNIARPKNMTSISNMPKKKTTVVKSVENLPDYLWDFYDKSLPMSTYLVAFAVTDFQHKTNGNFSVWARSDSIKSAEYALKIGPKILKFLEEFFNIPFPLPKIDMIALPDFHAGAMENWGLITYRETTMLFEEGISASGNRQRVATVVAHELAHQWFGNLVTPSWWSDIWLNEGFASYMEYLCVDGIEPTWKSLDQFVVSELQNVFVLDALSSSHKISVEVGNPDEINEIFDRISYSKGSAIIRMMSHFLTSKVFRKGLTNYLNETAYKSATQDDLWRFLTDIALTNSVLDSSTSVKEIMDTWTLQTGFPLVTISYDSNSKRIHLKQERFKYKPSNSNEIQPLWWIPLTYTTSKKLDFKNTRTSYWMRRTETLDIDIANVSFAGDWYIFNIQQTGYYRVNYDKNNWNSIISHLRDPKRFRQIAPSNRAQLIDDALNLARAGYLSYDIALDVTRYLEHEDDYVPWKAAITSFHFLDSMLIRKGDYKLMKEYILGLLGMVYEKVGFEDPKDEKDMLTVYKRIDILTTACHLGHTDCMHKCITQFRNWMFTINPDFSNPISPNLKGLVYCTAVQYGTEAEWDFTFERFLKSKVSSEKELLLSALGCSREPWILIRFLQRAFMDKYIRKQDVYRVFAAVSNNIVGQPIVFNYIRSNWNEMKSYLGSSITSLNLILKYATRRMSTQYDLDELTRFINTNHKEYARTIQQAVEQVQVNIEWMNKNYESIINWLKNVTNDE